MARRVQRGRCRGSANGYGENTARGRHHNGLLCPRPGLRPTYCWARPVAGSVGNRIRSHQQGRALLFLVSHDTIRLVSRVPPSLLTGVLRRWALSEAGSSGDRALTRGPGAVGVVRRGPQGPLTHAPEPADLQARDPPFPAPTPHRRPVHPEALGRLLRAQEDDVVFSVPSFALTPESSYGAPTVHPFAYPRPPTARIRRSPGVVEGVRPEVDRRWW